MPLIYDFACECGHEAEKLVKTADEPVECPKCGARMKRQLSAPQNFQDKGTLGFHKGGANFSTKTKK